MNRVYGTPQSVQRARAVRALTLGAAVVMLLFACVSAAFAGRSASGELAFYPCTECHPVTVDAEGNPTSPLPIDFQGHQIELEVHDVLGSGSQACLACHSDPGEDPGQLVLPDGSLVEITGDTARVCQRCHFEKYREWQVGIHGKHQPTCMSAGCHDPHTPSWIYVPALPPFQGTGIEVRAVSEREPFVPLAGPPVPPAVLTPPWLIISASLGAVVMLGAVGYLVSGRFKR